MLDAIVIGAGTAGLAAARELSRQGLQIEVLEARPRIGGRIQTIHDSLLPVPVEGGAEFVHGTPPETWQVIRAARLAAAELPDAHWHFVRGRLRQADFWTEVEPVLSKLSSVKRDMSFAEFVRTRCRHVPERVKAMATGYVEGFNAADAGKISCRALSEAEDAAEGIEADRNFRLVGGYDGITTWLAAGLRPDRRTIRLGTTVSQISWKAGSVQVIASAAGHQLKLRARLVIITVPIGVLKAGRDQTGSIVFDPEPTGIREALQQVESGPVVKIAIAFREPFWERTELPTLGKGKVLRDMVFLHSQKQDATFLTWWSMLPVRASLLVGWAAGPASDQVTGKPAKDALRLALADLSRFTGVSARSIGRLVQGHWLFDWPADPFSRGAYSYVTVGGADVVSALAKPVGQTLYFAGEATHSGMSGTVSGAIASGYRAAKQVLAAG